jgi:hypothetical protein
MQDGTETQDAELIGDIYEGSHDPALWNRALTAIRDRVGANVVVMLGVDQPTTHSEMLAWTELDPQMGVQYDAYWGRHDPWPAAMLARGRPGEVLQTRDLMQPEDFLRSSYYNEFWRPHDDLFWSAGGYFHASPDRLGVFGVPRARLQVSRLVSTIGVADATQSA